MTDDADESCSRRALVGRGLASSSPAGRFLFTRDERPWTRGEREALDFSLETSRRQKLVSDLTDIEGRSHTGLCSGGIGSHRCLLARRLEWTQTEILTHCRALLAERGRNVVDENWMLLGARYHLSLGWTSARVMPLGFEVDCAWCRERSCIEEFIVRLLSENRLRELSMRLAQQLSALAWA